MKMNKNGDKSIKMSNIKLDYKSSKGLKVFKFKHACK